MSRSNMPMWQSLLASVIFSAIICVAPIGRGAEVSHDSTAVSRRVREFDFTYGAAVKELPAGKQVRIWVPVPQSNTHQTIELVSKSLPAKAVTSTGKQYGNQAMYFETEAPQSGEVEFSLTYRVKRWEVTGLKGNSKTDLTDGQRKLFLNANSKVPIDGKPVDLIADLNLPKHNPLMLGKLLYGKVGEHMRYDKSMPGYGTGDSVWACESQFGNCTDFHSLFISMARSQGVPARFEIGFPLPPKRGEGKIGGYHCWAFFHAEKAGWVPVDISEADKHPDLKDYYFGNLTEDRVQFTVGRDLILSPQPDSPPLNYFVYPHVEVAGKQWPLSKMEKRFSFKDH